MIETLVAGILTGMVLGSLLATIIVQSLMVKKTNQYLQHIEARLQAEQHQHSTSASNGTPKKKIRTQWD